MCVCAGVFVLRSSFLYILRFIVVDFQFTLINSLLQLVKLPLNENTHAHAVVRTKSFPFILAEKIASEHFTVLFA